MDLDSVTEQIIAIGKRGEYSRELRASMIFKILTLYISKDVGKDAPGLVWSEMWDYACEFAGDE